MKHKSSTISFLFLALCFASFSTTNTMQNDNKGYFTSSFMLKCVGIFCITLFLSKKISTNIAETTHANETIIINGKDGYAQTATPYKYLNVNNYYGKINVIGHNKKTTSFKLDNNEKNNFQIKTYFSNNLIKCLYGNTLNIEIQKKENDSDSANLTIYVPNSMGHVSIAAKASNLQVFGLTNISMSSTN